MKRAAAFLAIAVALLAAMALKDALLVLPSPPAQANGPGFDANRAMARLTRILGDQRPHPVDSDAGDAVRERLLTEMRAVGLNPRVTDDFACNSFARSRTIACARVRNLVATIGPAEGRHVLLVSHYDSTFAGPGAGDDGIGTAAMLEIAHLLRDKRLARPVTFLFNEGEEMGLLGARAFLDRDPLAARVDTVVNLEARGVNGPAIMFETSRPNGAAIDLYRVAPRPVANSLSTDLYRLIPNSTDVAVFEARPWTILNFAVIGNETRYHSAGDDLAALDPRSLQHMGSQALAVTERAAAGDATAAEGERLYTDIAGLGLVVLPMLFGFILLGILLLFFLVEGWRRRALGMPLLAMAAALAGSAALAWLGQFIVGLIRAGDFWRAYPVVTTTAVYASALAACLIALLLVARTAERTRLRAAFWLLFLLLGGGLCLIAPGAAIYFLAPPLLAALGMAGRRWWDKAEQAGAIAAAIVLYLTFGPALALFEELMSSGPHWTFAPLGAIIMLPALIEVTPFLSRMRTILAVAGGLDLAILGWIVVGFTPAYSDDKQQLFTIEYVWDQATSSARFAINNDGAPAPYDAAWERVEMPYTMRRRWAVSAPANPVAPPTIEQVGRQQVQGGTRIRLRLRTNGAHSVTLIVPASASLLAAGAPDFMQRFGAPGADERYFIRCVGRACDGALIDVVGDSDLLNIIIVGSRPGLPTAAAPIVRARPLTARPQYGSDATITLSQPGTRWVVEPMRPSP